MNVYIPERGDIVYMNFSPQTGREQSGRRPALTLSSYNYNALSGLAVFCPITSRVKGYPFEVNVGEGSKTEGVVLSDQVKSIDWERRGVSFVEKADDELVEEVLEKLGVLLEW